MLYNNLVASRAHIVISIRVHGGSFDERKIKIKIAPAKKCINHRVKYVYTVFFRYDKLISPPR